MGIDIPVKVTYSKLGKDKPEAYIKLIKNGYLPRQINLEGGKMNKDYFKVPPEDVVRKGQQAVKHYVYGSQKTAGVFDPVLDNRMGWLWAWDDRRQLAYVKEQALDKLEGAFYDYLEAAGWPSPVSDWVLAMGIQGGAASFQWNKNSDVDVMVVIDWLKLFAEMGKWGQAQFNAVDLADQYGYLQRAGGRLSGKSVKRKLEQCISGRGVWMGKGIRNKAVVKSLAPTHPIDYSIQRGLHHGDLRFDDQPPVVDAPNLSSYLVDLPVKRQRDEHGRDKKDTVWMNEIKKPPTGFSLEHDAPELYQKGLGQLRFVTMAFDFLYEPSGPKDIIKGMSVLNTRFRSFMNARTEGYRAWAKNPDLYTVEINGETYGHPDWFPNNVGVKLLEATGPKDGKKLIKEILRNKEWKDRRYVQRNFAQVAADIKNYIGPNYRAIRKLFDAKHKGRPFRFKNPKVARVAYGEQRPDLTPPGWVDDVVTYYKKKFKKANVRLETSNTSGSLVYHTIKAGKTILARMVVTGWRYDRQKSYEVSAFGSGRGAKMTRNRKEVPKPKEVIEFINANIPPEALIKIKGSRGAPPVGMMRPLADQVKESRSAINTAFSGSKIEWYERGNVLDGEYLLIGTVDPDGRAELSDMLTVLEVAVDWEDRKFEVHSLGIRDAAKTPRGLTSLLNRYLGRMMRKGLKALDPYVKDMLLGNIQPKDVIGAIRKVDVDYEYVDGKSLEALITVVLRKRTKKVVPNTLIRQWVQDNWRVVMSAMPKKGPPTYGEVYQSDDRQWNIMKDMQFPDPRRAKYDEIEFGDVAQKPGSLDAVWRGRKGIRYRVEYALEDDGY